MGGGTDRADVRQIGPGASPTLRRVLILSFPFPSPFHCAPRRGNSTQMDVELLGAWNEGVAGGRRRGGVDVVGTGFLQVEQ